MNSPTSTSETEPVTNSMATLRRLISSFRPVIGATLGVVLLILIRTAFDSVYPMLVSRVVESLPTPNQAEGFDFGPLYTLLWILAGVLLGKHVAFYFSTVAAASVGQDLENGMRTRLFDHVTRLRFRYHDKNRSGTTIARSLRDMDQVKRFFREVWFGYAQIATLFIVVQVMLFLVHWSYGVVTMAIYGVGIFACVRTGREIARLDKEVCDVYDDVTTVLQENVAGARVVRAFGRERSESHKFGGEMKSYTSKWRKLERYWSGIMPLINGLCFSLCVPSVLLLAGWRIANHGVGIGELVAALLYVRILHHQMRPLTRMVIIGQKAIASAARVFDVLDVDDHIEDPAVPATLPESGGRLTFQNVHFAYPGGPPVLRGISLDVHAGESVGIIGTTGAGKSTLVGLVPRYYEPTLGTILLDGHPLPDLAIDELRAAVGLVFQEAFLFSDTVQGNVAYGRPGATREDVARCIELSAAKDFVEELPKGYETMVGERGVSLSGGQRQRLTIARALVMNPRVLIFDDATASVDAATEKQLFDGIRQAAKGRTTLVISQRVPSVRWCDRIVVLDEGVLVAEGTHDELVSTSPLYAEIFRHQRLGEVGT